MVSRRINVWFQAEQDIDEETVYLAREASVEVGIRFFDAVQESFQSLLGMPGMGKIKPVNNLRLPELRQWPVNGFEKYLIFYHPKSEGIEIIRVLHGARDIDRILEREKGNE